MRTYRRNQGFTLIEILLVIAILGVIASLFLTSYSKRAANEKVEKAALQIQQLLQAGSAYYIDKKTWPSDINQADFQPYKPFGNDTANTNPWGYDYKVGPTGQSAQGGYLRFQVSTDTPSKSTSDSIAGLLPNAISNGNPGYGYVQAEVTIPGQALSNNIILKDIGYGSSGKYLDKPKCPVGMHPELYVAPQFVRTKYYDFLNIGEPPTAILTNYADLDGQWQINAAVYQSNTTGEELQQTGGSWGRFGSARVEAIYFIICRPNAANVSSSSTSSIFPSF